MSFKFRKKPIVIEAYQMTIEKSEKMSEWPTWLAVAYHREVGVPGSMYRAEASADMGLFFIQTLEGVHIVSPGDWIIRGIQGELYPCKPDIFESSYESA